MRGLCQGWLCPGEVSARGECLLPGVALPGGGVCQMVTEVECTHPCFRLYAVTNRNSSTFRELLSISLHYNWSEVD